MNVDIKALHFSLKDEEKDYLEKKITRIRNAENMITDLVFTFSKDAAQYRGEASVKFKWGVQAIVKEDEYELNALMDKLIDKLEAKITKEKEKNREKR
jgi:putative sigma-54 modulation protein